MVKRDDDGRREVTYSFAAPYRRRYEDDAVKRGNNKARSRLAVDDLDLELEVERSALELRCRRKPDKGSGSE